MIAPAGRLLVLMLLAGALGACSRRPPVAKTTPAVETARVATTDADEAPGTFDPKDPKHGTRKLMNLDAPVYVDGAETAVLRYGDLVAAPLRLLAGDTPEFSIYDYLASIGVPPQSIKSVHLHGNGDRIASIEGTELVKERNRFTFTFASQTTGAALQRWSTTGLKNPFVVHEIRKVSIFVAKKPPAIHPQRRCHLDPSGACTEEVPYAEGAPVHGTRVYVDGRMVGFVKRRQIPETVVMGRTDSGDYEYNVAKFVGSLGVKTDGVKAIEFVAGDDVVARATGERFAELASGFYFAIPKHSHGKARVHVPLDLQTKESTQDRDALVSSIHLYKKTNPGDRPLATITEDTDLSVQLAAREDEGHGGKSE